MSNSTDPAPTKKTLLFAGMIGLAAWGGYYIGSHNRSELAGAEAKAEASRSDGVGVVTEAPTAVPPPLVEPPVPAEPAPAHEHEHDPAPAAPAAAVAQPAPSGPAKFSIRTAPLATITITAAEGPTRSGRTDAAGVFRTDMLTPGAYSLVIEHADFLSLDPAREFTMLAGEATDLSIVLQPKPASLMVLADDRSEVFVDGKRAGSGGVVMIGEAPSRRALTIRVVNPTGPVEKTVTLAAKESRILDCRTPAPTPEPATVASADANASGETPAPAATPVKSAVKIISANPESKVIAFSLDTIVSTPPLAKGQTGFLLVPTLDKPAVAVKCVRTFANVSVCETPGVPEMNTPIVGELTH